MKRTTRTPLTLAGVALATVTLTGAVVVPPAAAVAGTTPHHRTDLHTVLQHDADALLAQGAPGVLVRLDRPGPDVRVRSGFGDVDRGTPVPWDARFRIGSFTKTFVSATMLQLVAEDRISLDDPVERWLPGVVRGHGNDGRRITVRQLMQHTSGVPEYLRGMTYLFDQEGFEAHRFDSLTPERAVHLAMQYPPDFAPGTSWNYSNTNYLLVGMIIERVTGRSWQQEVQRRIIRPLGLRHTYTPGTFPYIPGPHAVGYERFPGPDATEDDLDWTDPIDATNLNPSMADAAGGIISTAADSDRFLRALLGGRVLPPAQLAEMTRTVPIPDEGFQAEWPGARYGLGLMWVPNSCGGSWAHGGDIMGFMTRNGVTPDGSRSVTVSINTDSPLPLPDAPAVEHDLALDLIDHALCG